LKKLKRLITITLLFVFLISYLDLSQINQGFALEILAPDNFSVRVDQDHNQLTWENKNSTDITTYIIIEKSIDQGEFHQIANLSGFRTSYADYSISNGHVYTYRAQVVYKGTNKSPYTPEVEAVNLYPENFRIANIYTGQVDLEWFYPTLPINREPDYETVIERREKNKSSWKKIATLPITETFYRDTAIEPDTQYYYRIRIRYDKNRYSKYIPSGTGIKADTAYPLTTPLWGYGLTDSSIRLMWDMPKSEEAKAILERKSSSGEFIPIFTSRGNNYRDTGLMSGNTYTYRLCLESENGKKSEYTEEIDITVETVSPPSDLSVFAIASDKIVLTWDYSYENETGFEIWRKGEGAWEILSTVPKNTYTFSDGSGSYGKTYTYKVRAKRGDTCFSDFSHSRTIINEYPDKPGPLICYTSESLLYIFSHEKAPKNTTYTLEFRTSINSPWSEIRSVKNDVLMTNIGFNKDSEYYFRIRADIGNLSSVSQELRFFGSAPEPPMQLEATYVGYNRVTLRWSDVTGKEDGYRIYRTINGERIQIGSVGKDAESFIDEWPATGQNTYYEVAAYNLAGTSPSAGINVKIPNIIIFNDLDSYAWAQDAIYTLQGMGALDNIQSGSFYPQNVITKGQMAHMVLASFNIGYSLSGLRPPTDITQNHKYYKDIITAINLGLMHPEQDGRIYPNKAATRKDIILLLSSVLAYSGYPLNTHGTEVVERFNDFWQIPREDINIIASFVGDDIISGKSGLVLDLDANTTRIETVAFIYRTLLKYGII
jgi:fibronectin type 3 domain-containing protein